MSLVEVRDVESLSEKEKTVAPSGVTVWISRAGSPGNGYFCDIPSRGKLSGCP